MKPFKAAYDDIKQMVKAATVRLDRSMAAARERLKAADTAATPDGEPSPNKPLRGQSKAVDHFESFAGQGTAVKTVQVGVDFKLLQEEDKEKILLDAPVIFRVSPGSEFSKTDGAAYKLVAAAAKLFASSAAAATGGRENRSLKEEVADKVQSSVEALLKESAGEEIGVLPVNEFKKDLSPTSFVVAKNLMTVALENGGAPSFRLTHVGSRKVFLFPAKPIADFITKSGGKELAGRALYNFVKFKFTVDMLKEYMAAGGENLCFECTVGPGDALFTPTCWLYAERVANSDTSGVRAQVILASHDTQLEEYRVRSVASSKSNAVLDKISKAVLLAA